MITIATFTGRPEPRLDVMGRYLRQSIERCPSVPHEWLIVYEMVGRHLLSPFDFGGLNVRIVEPPPSRYRGGDLCWNQWRPDHPNGFNACIREARGDYLVILNDCQVVSSRWYEVASQMRGRGVGWGCKVTNAETLDTIQWPPEYDKIEEVEPECACGPCWAAPLSYFRKVRGFDGIYAGQYKFQDFDCARRMQRAGLRFESTRKAWAVTLTKGRSRKDISPHADEPPLRNRKNYDRLISDKERIVPIMDIL